MITHFALALRQELEALGAVIEESYDERHRVGEAGQSVVPGSLHGAMQLHVDSADAVKMLAQEIVERCGPKPFRFAKLVVPRQAIIATSDLRSGKVLVRHICESQSGTEAERWDVLVVPS